MKPQIDQRSGYSTVAGSRWSDLESDGGSLKRCRRRCQSVRALSHTRTWPRTADKPDTSARHRSNRRVRRRLSCAPSGRRPRRPRRMRNPGQSDRKSHGSGPCAHKRSVASLHAGGLGLGGRLRFVAIDRRRLGMGDGPACRDCRITASGAEPSSGTAIRKVPIQPPGPMHGHGTAWLPRMTAAVRHSLRRH